jgi:thiol:disulfide interchange protein DsbD
LAGFLLLAAGFGLLALLTPCVFPMIPVTVTFFTAQARAGRAGLRLALLFGAGLIVSYSGLGLGMTALLGASGAGRLATSPWVNLAVFVFFGIFALALLGWIAPALPAGWVQRLDRAAGRVQGPLGALLMGVAFTVTNFTCTMPFVGSLLLAAAQGQWLWPLVGMLVYSTVFSLPFVALALFPQGVLAIRGRSGAWLNQIRTVLALVEIGAALKFLSNADVIWGWGVVDRRLLLSLWAAIAAACGLLLIGGWSGSWRKVGRSWLGITGEWLRSRFHGANRARSLGQSLRTGLGVAFLGLAAYFISGIAGAELDAYTEAYVPPCLSCRVASLVPTAGGEAGARLAWLPSLELALGAAARTGKPIFIDFRGYTCVNCRWMDKKVIDKVAVRKVLRERFILVQLYTDGGPDGDNNLRLQVERFRTLALPYFVILSPDNAVLATHAGILPSVEGFLDFLDKGSKPGPRAPDPG